MNIQLNENSVRPPKMIFQVFLNQKQVILLKLHEIMRVRISKIVFEGVC